MPPKGERFNKKIEGPKEPLRIKEWGLLRSVSQGGEGVEKQYELERRYLPKRLLSPEELAKYQTLEIEQVYVGALNAEGQERNFRLRRTWNEKDGIMLRLARKRKVEGHPHARNESQKAFSENAPEAAQFNQLWARRKWDSVRKRRHYIPFGLPNGRKAEIHYDIHPFYPLEGLVRIEIEFERPEDEAYVVQHAECLPEWIGRDVTNDKAYGGTALAREGMPQGAQEIMEELRKTEIGAR
jgi:CYTH domain-containing protein